MDSLPPELSKWDNLRFIKQRGPHEWSAECPRCGDSGHTGRDLPDRFRMFDSDHTAGVNARGWCRHCGHTEWADEGTGNTITDEMRTEWRRQREQREAEERQSVGRAIAQLNESQSWLKYHDGLTPEAVEWWRAKGIPDHVIKVKFLGWCGSREIWHKPNGSWEKWVTPTATIPVFTPEWRVTNIKHRLINPYDDGDKYRPERGGLPSTLYLADPDMEIAGRTVVLVEGEIKSLVVWDRLQNPDLTIIGTPSKNVRPSILEPLVRANRVYIALDPGADQQAREYARRIGSDRCRIVNLPCKPDDMFTRYGAAASDFMAALRYGRKP